MADIVTSDELHRVVVQCIIFRKKARSTQYFVMKRSQGHKVWPGLWTVPGGGIDPRRDYDSALIGAREVSGVLEIGLRNEIVEETGMHVGRFDYFGNTAFKRPDGIRVIAIRFMARFIRGPIVLDTEDSTEFKWIRAYEAKDYDMIGTLAKDIERLGG